MSGFRTCLIHTCFSPELFEPRPEKCKCRKLVTPVRASEMVELGEANWVWDYSGKTPVKTWNIALNGRQAKTPRAHTLEKAHMERGLERKDYLAEQQWLSDEGKFMRNMEALVSGAEEQAELFEVYHDLEIEERYNLFLGMNSKNDKGESVNSLRELKKFSDTFGTVEGEEGRYVTEIITSRANQLKFEFAVDDPYEGRVLFPMIGQDQRTKC